MNRAERAALIGFAVASYLLMCGNRSNCDRRVPTLTCDAATVTVNPGTCTVITNPCGDHQWLNLPRVDGLTLCDAPDGISLTTDRSTGTTVRSICASATVGTIGAQTINFIYGRGHDLGLGTITLSTAEPLQVQALAVPNTIDVGGAAQLGAIVQGGIPPYTFSWAPPTGLSSTDSQFPTARPVSTTTYVVTVSDSSGHSITGPVVVNVRAQLALAARPPAINVGESSQLSATALGGTPPYRYSWTPAASLDDPTIANPIASPINTTTYSLTVIDSVGARLNGSVVVTVNMAVTASADPAAIIAGQSAQLDSAVQGGLPPYHYLWTPAASLDAPTSSRPVASPSTTTMYTVVVTDALGASASANTTVNVSPAGGGDLAANFTWVWDGFEVLQLDASSSTGDIVQYAWDFSWQVQNPDLTTSSPHAVSFALAGTTGSITLTVTARDGSTATRTLTFP